MSLLEKDSSNWDYLFLYATIALDRGGCGRVGGGGYIYLLFRLKGEACRALTAQLVAAHMATLLCVAKRYGGA